MSNSFVLLEKKRRPFPLLNYAEVFLVELASTAPAFVLDLVYTDSLYATDPIHAKGDRPQAQSCAAAFFILARQTLCTRNGGLMVPTKRNDGGS